LCAVYPLGEALLVVIGDVTGHAYDAALLCAVAKGACDVAVREVRPLSASKLLELLNTTIRNAASGRVSMSCSVALVASRTMTVASAGHPLPYVVRNRDGHQHIEGVKAFGNLLGTAVGSTYETTTVPLRSGDRVLWYTDGVIDCENEDGARFGHRRIRGLLRRADGIGARGLVRELSAELRWFRGEAEATDDASWAVAHIK
jgi:serine phosphatase RsbU (regulator of sigma subunit)